MLFLFQGCVPQHHGKLGCISSWKVPIFFLHIYTKTHDREHFNIMNGKGGNLISFTHFVLPNLKIEEAIVY